MTFEFFLPQNGTLKNIHLNFTDKQQSRRDGLFIEKNKRAVKKLRRSDL